MYKTHNVPYMEESLAFFNAIKKKKKKEAEVFRVSLHDMRFIV